MDMEFSSTKDPLQVIIEEIDTTLRRSSSSEAAVLKYTEMFTNELFAAIEGFVGDLIEAGIPGLPKPRRYTLPTGKEALRVKIGEYRILFVPLLGTAWANPRDEARVPGVKFKEECGRIAVFLSENPDRESFYDFLIWGDGSWFAWGYGWPKQADEYGQTNFRLLAAELINSFVKDIHRTWKTRDESVLGDASSANIARRVFTYGLPGDE